ASLEKPPAAQFALSGLCDRAGCAKLARLRGENDGRVVDCPLIRPGNRRINEGSMPRQRILLPVALFWPFGLWLMLVGGLFVFTQNTHAQSLEETQQKFIRGQYEDVIKIAKKQA